MNTKKSGLAFFLIIYFLLLAGPVFALKLEINYPTVPGADSPQVFLQKVEKGEIPSEQIPSLYAKYIFNLAIWLTGLIALAVLIIGGLRYLLSAGNSAAINSAKEQILAGFLGILILLCSVIVFNVINPQLIVFKLSELAPIKFPQRADVSPPEEKEINTSIDTELPFGRIIEGNIFETYVSTEENREPRMTRITNIANNILGASKALTNQNKELNNIISKNCKCKYADNEGNSGSCSGDTCKYIRSQIEKIEQKNVEEINNLLELQKKAETQIKELRTELDRLARAEVFIKTSPQQRINSLTRLLTLKNYFMANDWVLRTIKFWNDINIVYFLDKNKTKRDFDWATFYSAVSGTTREKFAYPEAPVPDYQELEEEIMGAADEETKKELEDVLRSEVSFTGKLACATEAPAGEIIDRTERTGHLLVERIKKLIALSKEMIKAVDEMQVLVSRCTSQLPRCRWDDDDDECKNANPEGTCPFNDIKKQLEKIKEILDGTKEKEGIKQVVEAKKPGGGEEKEKIGIVTIIDKIVPEILKDLKNEVRDTMKMCFTEGTVEEEDKFLFNCLTTANSVGTDPKGEVVRKCCEPNGAQNKMTPFGECLQECYLEKGYVRVPVNVPMAGGTYVEQKKYRKCLQECLDRKSQEEKKQEISWCRHPANFYCCHIKK